MEDLVSIKVTRPVFSQFQKILIEAQFTSDGLMKHFFHLYYRSLNQVSREDPADHQITLKQPGGDNFSRLVVNIPKTVLHRDISVNVMLPDSDCCETTDHDNSFDDSPTAGCTVSDTVNAENGRTDKINPNHKDSTQHQTLVCNVCQFKTKGIKKFKNHIRKHSEKQISCPCGETFLDDSNLKLHIQSKHATTYGNRKINDKNKSVDDSNHFNFETTLNKHGDNRINCGMEENLKQMILIQGDNRINRLQDLESSKSSFTLQDDTEKGHSDKKQLYSKVKIKRKGFFCNFCCKTFPRFGIFLEHRNFCKQRCLILCCNCQMKFRWKSKYLHHRIKCKLSMDVQIGQGMNKFCLRTMNGFHQLDKVESVKDSKDTPRSSGLISNVGLHEDLTFNTISSESQGHTLHITDKNTEMNTENGIDKTTSNVNYLSSNHKTQTSHTVMNLDRQMPYQEISEPSEKENGDISTSDVNKYTAVIENSKERSACYNVENTALNTVTEKQDLNVQKNHVNAVKGINTSVTKNCIDLSCVKQEPIESLEHPTLDGKESLVLESNQHSTLTLPAQPAHLEKSVISIQSLTTSLTHGKDFFNSFLEDGETTVKCEECGEIFKRKAYLKEHVEGKHGGDMRYSCDCGKKFKWRSSLGNHRKHCYEALLSVLPNEGQVQGQNVSVIDFSQCGFPHFNMQNEWLQEIEKISQSDIFPRKPVTEFGQGCRQRSLSTPEKTPSEIQSEYIQRRKSESVCKTDGAVEQSSSLRINTSLVKPLADALSKYKLKPAVLPSGSNNKEMITSAFVKQQNGAAVNKNSESSIHSNGVIDLTFDHNSSRKINSDIVSNENIISSSKGFGGIPAVSSRMNLQTKSSDSVQQNYPQQRRRSLHNQQTDNLTCNFCKENFESTSELERHKLFCKHLQDTCSVCGKTFQHRTELVNHLLTYHGNDEIYTCFCRFRSSSWNLFEKHCGKCEEFKNQSASLLSADKNTRLGRDTSLLTHQLVKNYSENKNRPCLDVQPLSKQNLPVNEGQVIDTFNPISNSSICQHKSPSGTGSSKNQYFNLSQSHHMINKKISSNHSTGQEKTSQGHESSKLDEQSSDQLLNTSLGNLPKGQPRSNSNTWTTNKAYLSTTNHQISVSNSEVFLHSQFEEVLEHQFESRSSTQSSSKKQKIAQNPSQNNQDEKLQSHMTQMLPTISSFVTSSDKQKVQIIPSRTVSQSDLNHSTKTNSNEQIRLSKRDVYVCTFCGNIYNNIEKFSEHNKIHHGNQWILQENQNKQSKTVWIPPEDKTNQSKTAVDVAMDKARQLPIKMGEFVCHLCGDKFAAKAYLKEHIGGKHGTVDRYKCPCGLRFKWRSSLGIHQKKCPKSNRRTYNRWNSN
ncbi:KRAB [Mytilus coruscus]|uniref:KRAB n=1 Tax=Mytilus coruscus TaxID=42192 RepID=A0A6J8DPB1_MYTCO|nr:KRAB [Mytilus coruscus]